MSKMSRHFKISSYNKNKVANQNHIDTMVNITNIGGRRTPTPTRIAAVRDGLAALVGHGCSLTSSTTSRARRSTSICAHEWATPI